MARSCAALLLIFLTALATFLSNAEGSNRKLLSTTSTSLMETSSSLPLAIKRLFLGALPKGTVPPSSPSNKGHLKLDNQQLFRRHLGRIDRFLQVVPSPGAGH
ncbi:hypothetical protein K2173_005430 [Erythroxylum novogranatense]|uniref:Uncharacterized protein n=1 Tax=Erythroxylum novogranatense TaxID=1862640 RepID=A0AAV8T6N2_9ROSI|nr:hypothetical protein K2173_005430 [Erythroxylum novogranatense]